MSVRASTYGDMTLVNSTIPLDCPEAKELSIAMGDGTYSRFPYSVEIAFLSDGEFVAYPGLEQYDMQGVYGYVPLDVLASIIDKVGSK